MQGKRAKEPDVAEFVSALAAGNNARLMVVACAGKAEAYTMQALVAAAHQTGGRVVCILRGYIELRLSIEALGRDASGCIEFVVGEAQPLLLNDYKDADFVLIDCNIRNIHQRIFQAGRRQNDAIVLGYNAFSKGSWRSFASNAHLLPIGEGLSVSRIRANAKNLGSRKSHWVVKVDKFTGEEHVFRIVVVRSYFGFEDGGGATALSFWFRVLTLVGGGAVAQLLRLKVLMLVMEMVVALVVRWHGGLGFDFDYDIHKITRMGCWSAENATKAYLKTIKMGERAKEPDVAEFISALAAGNNAQIMVVASCATTSSIAASTALGLVAAAHQTGGRIICIVRDEEQLHASKVALGCNVDDRIEFEIGEARTLLSNHYKEADLVVLDCNLENYERILSTVQASERHSSSVVLGYNAFCKDSWRWSGSRTHLLPIGEGLLLTRIAARAKITSGSNGGSGKRNHWVVRVDKCTGEEHVFRVRSPHGRVIKA
ncbi:hypothetical protein RJ639_027830 [Escallonia herrerae]|uniref:Uncharacterized protein n=1 Tax=Escallonia herrerae TaxID=1293975 RepID=A0AA88X634_9ASTE|nr:hypothetical protein RJ639_027830 [Escallonia herrerae]